MFVTNTIVFSHENGLESIDPPATTLVADYNLLSNTTNYDGASAGPKDILNQDPLFRNAAGDDFHLTSDSPAIDKGTSSGAPAVDFENDSRPQQAGVDIGADEFGLEDAYLPIILKSGS
jgi:hypothetical protein